MATFSTSSSPAIDDLDQDPNQSPDVMPSDLDQIYDPNIAPPGGMMLSI